MAQDRWYNPLMRWLLRSPFHGLVSRSVLLITFTGHKTGRTYSTPVSYGQKGSLIQLISHRDRAWWRNFEGGVAVTVCLRGQDRDGTASIVEVSRDELIRALGEVYPGMPAGRAAQLADDSVLIHIHLTDKDGQMAPSYAGRADYSPEEGIVARGDGAHREKWGRGKSINLSLLHRMRRLGGPQ